MSKVSLRWFIQRTNWRGYLVRWNVSEREWWIFYLDPENVDGCNDSVQLRWKRTRISQWWKELNQGMKGGSWSCYCWSWKDQFIGFLKKKTKKRTQWKTTATKGECGWCMKRNWSGKQRWIHEIVVILKTSLIGLESSENKYTRRTKVDSWGYCFYCMGLYKKKQWSSVKPESFKNIHGRKR